MIRSDINKHKKVIGESVCTNSFHHGRWVRTRTAHFTDHMWDQRYNVWLGDVVHNKIWRTEPYTVSYVQSSAVSELLGVGTGELTTISTRLDRSSSLDLTCVIDGWPPYIPKTVWRSSGWKATTEMTAQQVEGRLFGWSSHSLRERLQLVGEE